MKIFTNIFKSEFAKNVLTLMTGTTIAQAIPIAVTPILTRIYTPEDFGIFALFLAITAITGAIANAQYEKAIVLPEKDEDALSLLSLSVIISTIFSVLLLVLVLLFKNKFALSFGDEKIGGWLFLVPISTFLIGLFNALSFFNIRKKKFKNVSTSLVTKSTSLTLTQTLLGSIISSPLGLILGQIVSNFSGNTVLYKTVKEENKNFTFSKIEVKKQAKLYKKFPQFSLPSIFLNSINLNLINFIITAIASTVTLGFYSLSQRILGVPSRVIGTSFSQVYFQKASEEYKSKGNTNLVFRRTLKKLMLISVPIFLVLFIFAEPLFEFAFGDQWRIAGTYTKILIPLALARFVSSSLSVTLSVHQKQQFSLYINLLLLSTTIILFIITKYYNIGFEEFLKIYSYILAFEYVLFILIYNRISKGK